MSEGKDPAIKLFGKTIQLPEILPDCGAGVVSQDAVFSDGGGGGDVKSEDRSSSSSSSSEGGVRKERESNDNNKDSRDEMSVDKEEERVNSTISEDVTDPNATSVLNENPKTLSPENESATAKTSKSEEEQSETSNSQEKTLKKPDKILPCPRCNSMDTKFCYYNNYNVNQPRHFCKNCQRYWTAGGTMRNVPVGAGRRKNKTAAPQYRQITTTEAIPNELNHPVLNPNGTVLTFGSDTPLCDSMASVLQIADKTMRQDGFRKPEELRIPVPLNEEESASRSSAMDMQNCHGFSPQVPCFPAAPWPPYTWNPQMGPAFCPPGFPMPFYPVPPYWGCAVPVPVPAPTPTPTPGPSPWNVPWVAPPPSYAAPISPTLGKHSREGGEDEPTKENVPGKNLWVPKTLRIDDPDEAAKSSIWATLGIKNDRSDGGGVFKAFISKSEEKNPVKETSPALQANPAALSRSLNFQEAS